MDKIRIRGGARLKGEIPISGAKNAALPLMAACLLSDAPLTLTNVPKLADVAFMADLLRLFGVSVDWTPGKALGEGGSYRLCAANLSGTTADYDIVRKMRASFVVLGPLLARMGHAKVSLPGGCAIGARPVDLHLKAFELLGATVELSDGYVIASAPNGLKGATIEFPFASVGATENALMAATLADGRSEILNAAREPEIDDLGHCLIAMGGRISGLGTSRIVVDSIKSLHRGRTFRAARSHRDRDLCHGGGDRGGRSGTHRHPRQSIGSVIGLLEAAGAHVRETNRGLSVAHNGSRPISVSVDTMPFPGFPTDLQAQFMALMATSEGVSHIKETIFENRFMHVPELLRMGADIKVDGDRAVVTGVPRLRGAQVMATDLRASSSLVLAGLAAEGETIVNRVYHFDRGFERLEEKLSRVGADIERIPT